MVDDLRQVVESAGPRRDDLNETQSLSSTMVLPPSALAPPAPDPVAAPASEGTGSSAALADTVATVAPPPPARRRSSPRRLLAVGAVAAILALLVSTAALLWTGWSQPAGKQRDAGEDGNRARIMDLVRQGQDAQKVGNWEAAIFYYQKAESLDPKAKGLRNLREAAQRNASQASSQEVNKKAAVDFGILTATHALQGQSWDAAIVAANTVLQIDPLNPQARALLGQAQQGKARQSKTRQPQTPRTRGDQMASTTPLTSTEAPQPGAPEQSQTDSGTASIHIHIKVETEGSVVVSVGPRDLLRKTFERTSLFRGRRLEQTEYDQTVEIPAGNNIALRVLIAPEGQKGTMRPMPQNLRGGSSHRLEIVLSTSGGSVSFN
jgi:hypothetical protein